MTRLAKAAAAVLEASLLTYAARVPYSRNAEALSVLSEVLIEGLGVSRAAADGAIREAVTRRAEAGR